MRDPDTPPPALAGAPLATRGLDRDLDLDIAQDVLYGIAQLALEGVHGVVPASPPARMGELLTGRRTKGIELERTGDELVVDLNVHMRYGLEIPKVAAEVQRTVREAIASMTGIRVRSVNVTVEKIDPPEEPAPPPVAREDANHG
jgi:uncharacterized alkaline shock family protein YloU